MGQRKSVTDPSIGQRDTNHTDHINPHHYQGDRVMCIIEDFKLDFLDGQVIKYILRSGNKPGEPPINDYKKALWYLQRKIANEEKQENGNPPDNERGVLEEPLTSREGRRGHEDESNK
jgi:hypothetical protein